MKLGPGILFIGHNTSLTIYI